MGSNFGFNDYEVKLLENASHGLDLVEHDVLHLAQLLRERRLRLAVSGRGFDIWFWGFGFRVSAQ